MKIEQLNLWFSTLAFMIMGLLIYTELYWFALVEFIIALINVIAVSHTLYTGK